MIYNVCSITLVQKSIKDLVRITLRVTGETGKLSMTRVNILQEGKVGFSLAAPSEFIE